MLTIRIRNARKVTFNGRDGWIVSICGKGGRQHIVEGKYEAVSEHKTQEEALIHAGKLGSSRGIREIILESGGAEDDLL